MVSTEFFRAYYQIRAENPSFKEEDIDDEYDRRYKGNAEMINDHALFRMK